MYAIYYSYLLLLYIFLILKLLVEQLNVLVYKSFFYV
jgi:hypothetical protein